MATFRCTGEKKDGETMCQINLCQLPRPDDEMDPTGCIHNWGSVVWRKL